MQKWSVFTSRCRKKFYVLRKNVDKFMDESFYILKSCNKSWFIHGALKKGKISKQIIQVNFYQAYSILVCYLLSSLFSRPVPPTQAEYFMPALGEPPVKRGRTTNTVKSWNGTGLIYTKIKLLVSGIKVGFVHCVAHPL